MLRKACLIGLTILFVLLLIGCNDGYYGASYYYGSGYRPGCSPYYGSYYGGGYGYRNCGYGYGYRGGYYRGGRCH